MIAPAARVGAVRAAGCACLSLLAGCGLLGEFDPDLLRRDGGVDAGPDGGIDAGPLEEDCSVDGDEDGNGLADCDDFACVGVPRCCDADDPVDIVEDWEDLDAWTVLPSADPEPPEREPGRLTGFGVGTIPRAVRRKQCVPMVAGLAIDAAFAPQRDGACVGSDPCDAGLVLTAARDMTEGARLLDELSVRATRGGRVDVRQGGVVVAEGPQIPVGQEVDVAIVVGPGFDADDRPVLVATVSAAVGDQEPVSLVEGFPVTPLEDLVAEGIDCSDTPGLYVAVEGRGAQVEVAPLTLEVQACLNPSLWEHPVIAEDVLTLDRLAPGGWAGGGGLLAPALAVSVTGEEPDPLRFDLLFEGTDVPPDLEADTRVGYALGHGVAMGDQGWGDGWAFAPDPAPKAGDCHPSCLGDPPTGCTVSDCPDAPSYREPAAHPLLDSEGALQLLSVAWAVELDPASRAHGLGAVVSFPLQPETPFVPPAEVLTPETLATAGEDLAPCDSLRQPALAPAEPGDVGRRWLFFTCQRSGAADEIRAVTLSPSMVFQPGTEVLVLDPGDPAVAPHGAGGVSSPEVLVDFSDGDRATVRLWYLARPVPGAPASLALAQGGGSDAPEDGDPGTAVPALVPYPGNPVLRPDDPVLGDCPGECTLEGAAVARRPDVAGRLRFLLARRLDAEGEVSYELQPLEQAGRVRR